MQTVKIITTASLFFSLFLLDACAMPQSPGPSADGKISVVASFYPLAEFARRVGGDNIIITTIISAGTEPHDFEPTPQDIAKITTAGLFIYNGAALDPWAEKIASGLPDGNRSLNMSRALGIAGPDPHFWLDPGIAKKEGEIIRDRLIEIDPAHAQDYRQNSENYSAALDALDGRFSQGLSECETREIFTSHAAFAYMAEKYGLTQSSIAGLSPEAEPTARQLADLVTEVKSKNIKYIFFETLASPKLAETLAQETGARTLVLNPLEGLDVNDIKSGRDYISIMEDNLANLKTALNCR